MRNPRLRSANSMYKNHFFFRLFIDLPGKRGLYLDFLRVFLAYVNFSKFSVICGGNFNIDMLGDADMAREIDAVIKTNGCLNVIIEPHELLHLPRH